VIVSECGGLPFSQRRLRRAPDEAANLVHTGASALVYSMAGLTLALRALPSADTALMIPEWPHIGLPQGGYPMILALCLGANSERTLQCSYCQFRADPFSNLKSLLTSLR
jgi:hypothetical protein